MEPLKPLEAIPVTRGAIAIKIDPSAKYLVFVSRLEVDPDTFIMDENNPLPVGTPVYFVDDVDKAARIYQLLDTHKVNGTNGH